MAESNTKSQSVFHWSKFAKWLHVAWRSIIKNHPSRMFKRFKLNTRWRTSRFHQPLQIIVAVAAVLVIAVAVHHAYALSTWTQTDWSGGVGTSTTNQYSSQSNTDPTGTPGQLNLPNTFTTSGNEITDSTRTTNTQGDGVTPPDSSTGIWESTTNLVPMGGFEANVGGWTTQNGTGTTATLSRITTDSKFGAASGSWNVSAVGTFCAITSDTLALFNTGQTYTVSLWAKLSAGTAGARRIGIMDNNAANQVLALQNFTPTGSWQRFSFTFTAAISGNVPRVYIQANNLTGTVLVDGVQVEQKGYATPYVETNGTTATRGVARVRPSVAATSITQGWYAARVRMDLASTAGHDSYIGQPLNSANNRLALHVNGSSWTIANVNGSVDSTASITSAYSAGTLVTVVYAWTASNLSISVNGGAFVTSSRASIPPGSLTNFDIGSSSGASQLDGDVLWAAGGTGTLTNADATTLNTLGSSDPAFSSLQSLNSGAASPTLDWDGTSSGYPTTGTLTSAIFDGAVQNDWANLSYTASTPAGTSISVKVRGGSQPDLSDAPAFSSCSPISSGNNVTSTCLPDKSRYAQYQVTFTGTSSAVPNLQDISINYSPSDVTPPPTNASSLAMYRSNGGVSVASNGWTNTKPYFTWTAGADNAGGSGIMGYCLYLGQDPNGNPVTSKGDLGTSPLNTNGACPFSVSTTSVDTSLSGYIGTALTTSSSPYYFNVKAIDNAGNIYNSTPAQFQFLYDNTLPTNPAFISAPSQFVSNKQVTLTWPTSGSGAASDDTSGLAGLQYRIGSGGTWYGVNHNGNQDPTDLLPNNGSYTTISNPDFANLVEGNNIVYFRTWDVAGNVSTAYVTTVIKINTTSPSSPQNLTPSPTTNTVNSFGFSWLPPATYTGSASNITYCYTVNALPNSGNCTYTAAGQTSLSAGAYATEPGDNTFYVVAKDEAGNINYATYASATFTANTAAPGIPLNIDIADISVKSTSNWKLAVSWETPSSVGAGVASYRVYRSTDNVNFTSVASTAGTSYVDSGLSQQTYYYKVQACDSANNCGVFTNVVSLLPTGKFTSPANLISGPSVSDTTRTANITWTTDRNSDSSVEYGLSSGHYFTTEAANNSQVTSHSIMLNSLTAGTTYYFRAQWTDVDGNTGTSAEGVFTTQPAPTISDVTTSNINLKTATIQFTSSNATAVQLEYGGGVLSNIRTQNTSTTTSTYSIPLTGLNPGTVYTFRLNPFDTSGNIYNNPTSFSFTTPPEPKITDIQFEPVPGALTGTEQVSWTTNVPATSDITYGQPGKAQQEAIDSKFVTEHTMTVSDMPYNTLYNLVARSTDQLGNTAVSDQQVFHTGLDTRPPRISSVNIQPSIRGTGASAQGQLVISWKTDKAGTSQVAYGQGSSGSYGSKTAEDTALVTNHVVVVSNLATSQVYHLQVLSKDSEGVLGVSPDQTTIIGQSSDSALGIVFNALRSIFGL